MKTLLIKEIKKEFDHLLKTKYKDYLKENSIIELDNKTLNNNISRYTLAQLYEITDDDIYDMKLYEWYYYLKELAKKDPEKYDETIDVLEFIPIFQKMLEYRDEESIEEILPILFAIHTGDMDRLNMNTNIKDLYSVISNIKNIMNSKDYSFNPILCSVFLGYINEKKDTLLDPEYIKELEEYQAEFNDFLAFYTSPEVLEAFNSGKIKKLTKDDLAYDNYRLVRHVLGFQTPNRSNQFINYKTYEDLLLNSNSKQGLLTVLCYTDLTKEKFEKLPGITITMDDVDEYIKRLEDQGFGLSNRQIETLFLNAKKLELYNTEYSYDDPRMTYFKATYPTEGDVYNLESNHIKSMYNQYIRNVYAFTPQDFIDDFNNNHRQIVYNRASRASMTAPLLTRELFDEIINHRCSNIANSDTATARDYLTNCEVLSPEEEESIKNYKGLIQQRYQDMLLQFMKRQDTTINFFIYNNVPSDQVDDVKDLWNWLCDNQGYKPKDDYYTKGTTREMLYDNLNYELWCEDLNKRTEILNRYIKIVEEDELGKDAIKRLRSIATRVNAKKFQLLEDDILEEIIQTYDKDFSLSSIIEKFRIYPKDILRVLRNCPDKEICEFVTQKYQAEEKELRRYEYAKAEVDSKWKGIFEALLSSGMRIKDFCQDYTKKTGVNVTPNTLKNALRHHDYLDEETKQKVTAYLDDRIGHDTIDEATKNHISERIHNGITIAGYTRRYTLLDLYIDLGRNIDIRDLKYELLEDNPYMRTNCDQSIRVFLGQTIARFGYHPDMKSRKYYAEALRNSNYYVTTMDGKKVVTDEDKELAIKFIDEMNWPSPLYAEAAIAAARGEYDFKEMLTQKTKSKENQG